ncbi:MAG: hypothetical protein LBH16_00655 [Treponema sp.]|jgi:hypothetical protein|nr:hypothetical protein [Treponema sp.]
MKQSLNDLYSCYISRNCERGKFEGMVYRYLLENKISRIFNMWTQDDYEDFLSWFYPRLRRAINNYRKTGVQSGNSNCPDSNSGHTLTIPADCSFETYIHKVMRISSREYRLQKITKSVTEYSAWSVHVPELYVYEEAPAYSYDQNNDIITQIIAINKRRKSPKQIITLLLKCYNYISDDFIENISSRTGIDAVKLKEMLEEMREKRKKKDDKNYLLRERVYCQFYRCITYEKRLSYTNENSVAHIKLKEKLRKGRIRLEKMRKRMAKIRTYASNREVSEVIGISKGAVDACFHNIRAKLKTLSDKAPLN